MKNFKFLSTLLLAATLFSCSSDSDSEPQQNPEDYFNVNYDNNTLVLSDWKAEKDGDYFRISGIRNESTSSDSWVTTNELYLYFHKDGTMIKTTMYDSSISGDFTSPFYFSKDLFHFQIESIDEVNKRIKVSFNGDIYAHEFYHLNAAHKPIVGSVFIPYADQNPNIPSNAPYGTTMKVNGQNWRGLEYLWTDLNDEQYQLKINGDDQYSINMVLPKSNLQVGSYSFSQNSDIFKNYTVNIFRYYRDNLTPNEFTGTGNLTIIEKTPAFVKGTFSFTAIDSETGETVVVTEGVFKEKL